MGTPWVPMGSHGYPRVSHGFLWISMGSHGYPMDSHGFPCIPMRSHGFLWVPVGSYGFPPHGFLWIPMASHGFPWVPHGFPWIPMDSYGFPWLPKVDLPKKIETKSYIFLKISRPPLPFPVIFNQISGGGPASHRAHGAPRGSKNTSKSGFYEKN